MLKNQPTKRPNGSGITRSPGLVLIRYYLVIQQNTKKKQLAQITFFDGTLKKN